MPRKDRIDYPNAIHHVTQRGDKRYPIFEHPEDRVVYLRLLEQLVDRFGWRLLTYCLMPNHLHLLVQTPEGNLSRGMAQLSGSYARKYNQSRGVPGHVFQGRFKNRIVTEEAHLYMAFAYIALNPVEPRLCRRPEDWEWSAHRALVGDPRVGRRRIVADDALDAFDRRPEQAATKYIRFVEQVADMMTFEGLPLPEGECRSGVSVNADPWSVSSRGQPEG